MFHMKQYLPQTLLGRSILIVIIPVLILQAATVFLFFDRHWSRMTSRLAFAVAGEVSVITQSLEDSQQPDQTLQAIQRYAAQSLDLIVNFTPGAKLSVQRKPTTWLKGLVLDTLDDELSQQIRYPYSVRIVDDEKTVIIDVQMPRGVLNVICLQRRLYSSSSYIFLLWMVSISMLLSVVAVISMRNQIRPIRKLAIAADRFGRGLDAENFKPEGAREVRQAARAFIDMRDRIRRQIEQRTAMLAGVSHDLRTPLTRMKLGLSMLPDNQDIAGLKGDVAAMERMMNAYLEFARGAVLEKPSATNLSALLQQAIENERRFGTQISEDIDYPIYMTIRPLALERAFTNILRNAAKYAGNIHVTVRQRTDDVMISVEDDGPGIPPEKYEDVFKPFVRLDPARNIDEGGVGLGLSISLDLVQAHGGQIDLSPSQKQGGLQVKVILPRQVAGS